MSSVDVAWVCTLSHRSLLFLFLFFFYWIPLRRCRIKLNLLPLCHTNRMNIILLITRPSLMWSALGAHSIWTTPHRTVNGKSKNERNNLTISVCILCAPFASCMAFYGLLAWRIVVVSWKAKRKPAPMRNIHGDRNSLVRFHLIRQNWKQWNHISLR